MKLSWIVAIGLVVILALVRLAFAAGAEKLPAGVKLLRNLAYVENGHEQNRLDLYLPEKTEGRLAAGRLDSRGRLAAGAARKRCPVVPMAGKGYAVASINYRFSQRRRLPRPDRGLQSGHSLAAGQCRQV